MEDPFLLSSIAQWKELKRYARAKFKPKYVHLLVVWSSSGNRSFHICKMKTLLISY